MPRDRTHAGAAGPPRTAACAAARTAAGTPGSSDSPTSATDRAARPNLSHRPPVPGPQWASAPSRDGPDFQSGGSRFAAVTARASNVRVRLNGASPSMS